MDTVILPAMTYGGETWVLTKYQEKKPAVVQQSMERSLLNVTKRDKIRNEIRSKTGVKDIKERVQCMKGPWAGHVARLRNTRWAKIASEWTLGEGKREKRETQKEVERQHRGSW